PERPRLRFLLLLDAAARGAPGRSDRGPHRPLDEVGAARTRQPGSRAGGGAGRGRDLRGLTGRGTDVPLQQPGRAARDPHGRGGRRDTTRSARSDRRTRSICAQHHPVAHPRRRLPGAGFLTKQSQVLLIVPGLAAAWVLFARTSWPKRLLWLLDPTGAMVASVGWWIARVEF